MTNPPPAPPLYTFGFLSQLVDIHFPSKGKKINNPAYNLQVSLTFFNASLFDNSFLAVLLGGANGNNATAVVPDAGAIQPNGLGYGGSQGAPNVQIVNANAGVPMSKSSFNQPISLSPSTYSKTFNIQKIVGQAVLNIICLSGGTAALQCDQGIVVATEVIPAWGAYFAQQVAAPNKTDSGIVDLSTGSTTEVIGANNFAQGGNSPKGSCWFSGQLSQYAPPPWLDPTGPYFNPSGAPSWFLVTPFIISVDFQNPNKNAVGLSYPYWINTLP